MEAHESPPIAALFEVVFDQKVGYTISWKRSQPDLDLDGVEYQSLPSGLHGVHEDLVYFVHNGHAGVSAFVRGEADERHRNANFVAVGALVPLSYGRLGKSWTHAAELKRLAHERLTRGQDARGLELYWKKHSRRGTDANDNAKEPSAARNTPVSLPDAGQKRKRARSDASTTFSPADPFSADHPALSMTDLVETFGPLIFPLYRAALLRKRILFMNSPPVQQSCNFVYLLSILSSIPPLLAGSLHLDSDADLRIQTLFSVGVHDMPFLMEQKSDGQWLACTTDDVLEEKKDLYDISVKLPSFQGAAPTKHWPRMRTADGKDIKATQRDLRRYRLLRTELDRTAAPEAPYQDDSDGNTDNVTPAPPSLARAPTAGLRNEVKRVEHGETEVCEPLSWSAMAYNGFMWWASAGEMEAWENEEARADRQLFEEVPEMEALLQNMAEPASSDDAQDEQTQARLKMAEATVLTAFFHRLTSEILEPLAELVESADDETEEGVADSAIAITGEDLRNSGLDSWSAADREFVVQTLGLYFGREAKLEEGGVRICGVRVC